MIFLLFILIILIDKFSCIYDVYQLADIESKLLIKILLRIVQGFKSRIKTEIDRERERENKKIL
jgi:hypothetical protein